jgi:UDP-N-acetylglucosamine--N-acetylmuramyl-(pentapeptide) pyrophosphoryl-undecaprenol N-acetylglucosamine transferase
MQSLRLLRMFRPDAVFATGGYGSVGVGIAAGLLRLPLVLFLPDVAAGLAVRSLVRFSTRIAVAVEPAREAMASAKTVLTGYPVRPGFFNLDPAAAKQHFGLDPSLPTLLVTGGSTGASVINENVAGWIEPFLARNQLIHISGRADEAWLQERRHRLPEPLQQRYHLYPYLYEDMPLALAAADLAVMRAGASTLGELPATGLPAILVPGAFSDQLDNALYLEREGAALMQPQSRLQDLQSQVESLLAKPEILEEMRANLARLSHPDAADKLAQLIIEVAK